MKVLIVDDKRENLEAAKQAAMDFPEIEFEFLTSASQGLKRLEGPMVDGIITDLFFPPEQDEELLHEYRAYIQKVLRNPKFPDIVREFYWDDWEKANVKLEDTIQVMKEGNIRGPLAREIRRREARGFNLEAERSRLANLTETEEPQYPYGGILMLRAKALCKRHVLITDLHRHAGIEIIDLEDSIDGRILLLPLVEEGVINLKEIEGGGGLTYIGSGELLQHINPEEWEQAMTRMSKEEFKIFRKNRKEQPASWAVAIKKALAQ